MDSNTIGIILLIILAIIFLVVFIIQFYIAKQLKNIAKNTEGTYRTIYDMWKMNKEG